MDNPDTLGSLGTHDEDKQNKKNLGFFHARGIFCVHRLTCKMTKKKGVLTWIDMCTIDRSISHDIK